MTLKNNILTVVACAILDEDNRILLAKRPEGKAFAGLWEFPGGKLEAGETLEEALIRELFEELNMDVNESCLAPFSSASHAYDDFQLLMPLYICRRWKGIIQPMEGQALSWVAPHKLKDYETPPADVGLKAMLRDFLV